ncbi:uncharacterized protein LOC115644989 [Gopherus evgoodei]|uniref:uncharacterized protein LOC115644989 n=1 Tax=Gopherus evgoodei TaxID=1825980 RepID=UPI0011CF9239|nr:uncharacterized protein LOC115644989 [Gopherus evgoodei]
MRQEPEVGAKLNISEYHRQDGHMGGCTTQGMLTGPSPPEDEDCCSIWHSGDGPEAIGADSVGAPGLEHPVACSSSPLPLPPPRACCHVLLLLPPSPCTTTQLIRKVTFETVAQVLESASISQQEIQIAAIIGDKRCVNLRMNSTNSGELGGLKQLCSSVKLGTSAESPLARYSRLLVVLLIAGDASQRGDRTIKGRGRRTLRQHPSLSLSASGIALKTTNENSPWTLEGLVSDLLEHVEIKLCFEYNIVW